MQIRVMSYNIQHGRDYRLGKDDVHSDVIDLPLMADVIRAQGADIVGLNEVRGRGQSPAYTAQAEQLAALLGYHCYFARAISFGGHDPYGNAILSRFPIQAAETVPIPDPAVQDEDAYYETRCLLKARFAQGLTVLVSHFGLAKAEEKNAVQTVLDQLAQIQGPVVLMGDFNMPPQDPLLAPLRAVLTDAADAFAAPLQSWPSDAPRTKIDYIFTRGAKVLAADIPAIVASDHRPHLATLEV